jgi:oligopeptide transport system substrate-binding protein
VKVKITEVEMKKSLVGLSVGFALVVGLCFAGCFLSRKPGDSKVKSKEKVLRYALSSSMTTFDPHLVQDGVSFDVIIQSYEGLIGFDENNILQPVLAEGLPVVSNEGRSFTFTLRRGAVFSNGRAVIASDVKYSFERALSPALVSPTAQSYLGDLVGATKYIEGKAKNIAGITVLDERHVKLTLVQSRAYFLGKLTAAAAFIVAKEEVEKGPKNNKGMSLINHTINAGTGPFRVTEYVPDSKIVQVVNQNYWGSKPKISKIERPIVKDIKTARNLYDTGQLDIVSLSKPDYQKDRNDPEIKDHIHFFNRASVFFLGFNQKQTPVLRDQRIRQAIACAINKKEIVEFVLSGINEQANSILPKGIPGYDPEFQGISYDLEKAHKLLKEAGFPGGKGLPVLILSVREQQPDLRKTVEVIKEQLSKIGIQVAIQEIEWGTYIKRFTDNQLQIFHMRWAADYIDPQNFLSMTMVSNSPDNHYGYANPQVDTLCRKADSDSDLKRRLKMYQEANRIAVSEAAWVPIYYQRDMELIKPNVSGVRDSLMGHLPHTLTEVR